MAEATILAALKGLTEGLNEGLKYGQEMSLKKKQLELRERSLKAGEAQRAALLDLKERDLDRKQEYGELNIAVKEAKLAADRSHSDNDEGSKTSREYTSLIDKLPKLSEDLDNKERAIRRAKKDPVEMQKAVEERDKTKAILDQARDRSALLGNRLNELDQKKSAGKATAKASPLAPQFNSIDAATDENSAKDAYRKAFASIADVRARDVLKKKFQDKIRLLRRDQAVSSLMEAAPSDDAEDTEE